MTANTIQQAMAFKKQSLYHFTFCILNATSCAFAEQKLIARIHKQLRATQVKVKTAMIGMAEGEQYCGRPATRWSNDISDRYGSTLPHGVKLALTGRMTSLSGPHITHITISEHCYYNNVIIHLKN